MKKGLSLIELIVAVAILAIIAKISVPAFQAVQNIAREAAVKTALGEMRAAIMAYSAAEIAAGRASRFATGVGGGIPTLNQVNDLKYSSAAPKIAPGGDVPENPYAKLVYGNNFDNVIANAGTRGSGPFGGGTAAGWYYNGTTGDIWARTNVNGEANF